MEQIDVIKRLVEANPDQMEFVTTAAGIEEAFANGKVASLIGMAICRGVDITVPLGDWLEKKKLQL